MTHFTTQLAPDELVVETVWPTLGAGWGFAFEELAQRRGDFALAMAACALRVEDGLVAEARVGVGSVVERPTLLETDLVGGVPTPDVLGVAVEPFGTMHASAAYLRHLTRVLVERAVLRAWENA